MNDHGGRGAGGRRRGPGPWAAPDVTGGPTPLFPDGNIRDGVVPCWILLEPLPKTFPEDQWKRSVLDRVVSSIVSSSIVSTGHETKCFFFGPM